MPVDFLHSFPLTHEQAVDTLVESPWSPEEMKWLSTNKFPEVYNVLHQKMLDHWYLSNRTFPLTHHYMRRFAIGDGNDMAALIVLNLLSVIRNEPFNLAGYVKSMRDQWLNKGIDPVTLEKKPKQL